MDHYVITIGRGYGSGGREIGRQLAEGLGVNLYDRKLLRLASDNSGINEALFANVDEKMRMTPLFRAARKIYDGYNGEVIPPDSDDFLSNENLFNYQAKVIQELASTESCVIVGRCSNYILKDFPNVLRVYIHAPLEDCVKRIAADSPLPIDRVRREVVITNKRRSYYYQYFTGQDWRDADYYDLCLNSSDLGFERCIYLIKSYLEIKLGRPIDDFQKHAQ